jgi:ribose transport system substrate-binding protein
LGYINLNVVTQAYWVDLCWWSKSNGRCLVAHPDVNVVITNLMFVLGAIKAIAKAGKTKDILIVAGADVQKEAIKYIMDTIGTVVLQ